MNICEFDCNTEAIHFFKISGKRRCYSNVNACNGKREKDNDKKKSINSWDGKEYPRSKIGKNLGTPEKLMKVLLVK